MPTTSRTHTFTGCWTCRKRRVKCDGRKPTCARCTTARIKCDGYGFHFDVPEGVQSKRQRLPADSRPDLVLKLSNLEIDDHLAEIDKAGREAHKGPFSVLSFAPKRKDSGQWLDVVLNPNDEDEEDVEDLYDVPWFQDRLRRSEGEDDNTMAVWTPPEERFAFSIPGYIPFINLSRTEWTFFEHFTTFVGDEVSSTTGMGPHAHRHRNLITAIALSSNTDLDATASVFHGICAVAGMSLSRMHTSNQNYMFRAFRHERLALRHLRACIEKGSTSYQTITAAIMVLMVFDYMYDRGHSIDGHMQAALKSLRMSLPKSPHAMVDASTITMFEEMLQGCVLLQTAPSKEVHSLRRLADQGFNYEGFVIPLPLIDVILQMHSAAVGKPPTFKLPEHEIASLETLLLACDPTTPFPDRARRISILCYHATLIYFARGIRRHPSCPDHLVQTALTTLTTLEPPSPEPVHSLVSWAAVWIGTECTSPSHRQLFMKWCDERTQWELSSVKGVREISQLVWAMRGLLGREVEGLMWFDFVRSGEHFSQEHVVMVKSMLAKGMGRGSVPPV